MANPAQYVTVENQAGFTMTFHVSTSDGRVTSETNDYPVGQSETIDLSGMGWSDNTTVFPVVHADWGKTKSGPSIAYSKNGKTATYEVKGTTLSYSITLDS